MTKIPVIGLLTDFGISDSYVAILKGKILSISPHVSIIDISHNIQSQNINQTAFILWSTYQHFPKNTIFICIVDPGVGTSRKILCAKNKNYLFLAPDNGILKYIFAYSRITRIVSVENNNYFSNQISNTFHGRDIFAPVAAYLANGLSINKLGPIVKPKTKPEYFLSPSDKKNRIYKGKIIHIDKFGNLITDVLLNKKLIQSIEIEIGNTKVKEYAFNYASAIINKPFLIVGSSGLLEISAQNKSAAKKLNVKLNSKFRLLIKKK